MVEAISVLFRRLVMRGLVFFSLMLLLSSCFSNGSEHQPAVKHTASEWSQATAQAIYACAQLKSKVTSPRRCIGVRGLQYEVQSHSKSASVRAYVRCTGFKEIPPALGICDFNNGKARMVSVSYAFNHMIARKCRSKLVFFVKGNFLASRSFILDYGINGKDRSEDDRYVISGAVKWSVFDPSKSMPKDRIFFSTGESKLQRFVCTAESQTIVNIEFSDFNNWTDDEQNALESYGVL